MKGWGIRASAALRFIERDPWSIGRNRSNSSIGSLTTDPQSVHAYIVGEHGDSQVPAWSAARIAGLSIEEFCRGRGVAYDRAALEQMALRTRNAYYCIVGQKGATFYRIASGLVRVLHSILRDQNTVLTVGIQMPEALGLGDVTMSFPAIVKARGIGGVLPLNLDPAEQKAGLRRRVQSAVSIGGRETSQGLGHEVINFLFQIVQSLLRIPNLLRGTSRPNGLPRAHIRHGELQFGQSISPHTSGNALETYLAKGGTVRRHSIVHVGWRRCIGLGQRARFVGDDEVGMTFVQGKALRLQMTVERFHQNPVNVGLDLRRLVRQEKVLTHRITLVA